jgi:hypothetical protein
LIADIHQNIVQEYFTIIRISMQRSSNFLGSPVSRTSAAGKSIVGDIGTFTGNSESKHSHFISSSNGVKQGLSLKSIPGSAPVSVSPSPSHSSQTKFPRLGDKEKGRSISDQFMEETKEPDDEVIRRLYGGASESVDDSSTPAVSAPINLQAMRRRAAKNTAAPMSSSDRKAVKLNSDQGKWLDMRHISNLTEIIPRSGNERVSMAHVRLHNLCKGELDPYGLSLPGGVTYAHLTGFGFNAFVQANMRPGHVRFLGRAPWGRGLWAGTLNIYLT